jgi:hypothetical protein
VSTFAKETDNARFVKHYGSKSRLRLLADKLGKEVSVWRHADQSLRREGFGIAATPEVHWLKGYWLFSRGE